MDDTGDTTIYKVVLNHEEQYSIWPADRENALGGRDDGKSDTRVECLAYVRDVCADLAPSACDSAGRRLPSVWRPTNHLETSDP